MFFRIKSNTLIKSGLSYSVTSTMTSLITMLVAILNMRWIGPEQMGIWQTVSIISGYLGFLQLGVQSGLNLELPILLGKNQEETTRKFISSALFYAIIVTSFLFVIAIIAPLIAFALGHEIKMVMAILVMMIQAVNSSITIHLVARYRSSRSFNILAKIYLIQAMIMVICISLIWKFGFYGFLAYTVIYSTVHMLLMVKFSPFKDIKPQFDKGIFIHLVKRGIIMMGFNQTRSFAQSIPQWFLLTIGGVSSVGLFAPALSIGTVVNLLPNQLSQFFQPQMGYKYGEHGKAKLLWPYAKKTIMLMPLFALPICAILYIFEPWVITTLFPKYVESISAIQIITFGFVFSTSFISLSILYSIKAYKEAAVYSITELLLYLIAPAICYYIFNMPLLEAIALSISVTYLFLYILNYFIVKHTLFLPKYNN